MAVLTVELRNLLKSKNFELFDFEYNFDDKEMKKEIEQSIIDYYFFYEIGQETPDRFKQVFKTKFLLMIDYYNKLHNTTLLEYNPLINYSINEALEQLGRNTTNQNTTGTSVSSGSNTDKSTNTSEDNGSNSTTSTNNLSTTNNETTTSETSEKSSDYPQQNISAGDYLDGAREGNGTNTSEGGSTNTGTVKNVGTTSSTGINSINGSGTSDITGSQESENILAGTTNTNYEKTIEGLTGITYQELISKERGNIIRIKTSIINELKTCFYLVY